MTGAALEEVVESLRKSRVVGGLARESLRRFLSFVEQVELPEKHVVIREGELGRDMYLIIEGTAQAERGRVLMNPMGAGAEFGSLGLLTDRPRAATVTTLSKVVLVKLSLAAWQALSKEEPAIALAVTESLFNQVRDDLMHLTDSLGALLQGRSLPRAAEVLVRFGDQTLHVATGTPLSQLLPREVNGHLVVGALLGQKPVSLSTPVVSSTSVTALTLGHWEGRQIYARSVQLLLLEAAHNLDPTLDVRMGPSLGTSQVVEVHHAGRQLDDLAEKLSLEMVRLAATAVPIRREHWTVDEAREHFLSRGWADAAQLLQSTRQATIPLVSCGRVYALSLGPMLADTKELTGFSLKPHELGLVLDLGGRDPRQNADTKLAIPRRDHGMEHEHREWLGAMGVASVGGFNLP